MNVFLTDTILYMNVEDITGRMIMNESKFVVSQMWVVKGRGREVVSLTT